MAGYINTGNYIALVATNRLISIDCFLKTFKVFSRTGEFCVAVLVEGVIFGRVYNFDCDQKWAVTS